MKFLLKADIEIEIDDRWLQETWEDNPVDDQEADALVCAIDSVKDALWSGQRANAFDPVDIRVKDVVRVSE